MTEKAIILHQSDNVATALADLSQGEIIKVSGHTTVITQAIPFGHKYALSDLKEGEVILKYGESIGHAGAVIRAGMHIHIHNVESQRGRGDQGEKNDIGI